MDVHTPQQRSKNMAAIKASNTKVEIILSKALWNAGYRYRKHSKTVFGKPDFTFKKLKIAIFVDSEFFHGKDFLTKKKPATNAEFWEKKISRNIERDKEVNDYLMSHGWLVIRFWSMDVRKKLQSCLDKIEKEISIRKF